MLKSISTIKLEGCQEREAIIRCTLVTNSPKPVPHVHRLGGEGNSNGNEGEFQEIVVSASKNDWIATYVCMILLLFNYDYFGYVFGVKRPFFFFNLGFRV